MALCRPREAQLLRDGPHSLDILPTVDVNGAQDGFNRCGHDPVRDDAALRGVGVDVAVETLLKACSC